MKKRLLLIGNAPIPVDISKEVNTFDYVFRINRMNNLPTTGYRVDGVFIAAHNDWRNVYKGGEYKDYYKRAKDVFVTPEIKATLHDWAEYLTLEQWQNIKLMDFTQNHLPDHVNTPIITTTIRVLDVLTSAKNITDNYEIWIAGFTVDGRGKMMEKGDAWINTEHRWMGHREEDFLKRLIAQGRVQRLIPEIDDNIHSS